MTKAVLGEVVALLYLQSADGPNFFGRSRQSAPERALYNSAELATVTMRAALALATARNEQLDPLPLIVPNSGLPSPTSKGPR